jgi:hypothetical protein
MVEIRKLQPSVGRIALPTKPRSRRSGVKVVTRRRGDFTPPTPQPTPCVLWQGTADRDGYGRMKRMVRGEWETVRVIRWVMSQVLGRPLLPDEFVLHACDNPPCFRVDHLSVGSVRENNADMKSKGRAVKPPINRFHGEAHPMAKLNAHQVRKIKGLYISGWSAKRIAAEFEVHPSTVHRIVGGLTWASGPQRDLVAEAREKLGVEATAPPQVSQAQPVAAQSSGRVKRRRIPTAEDLQQRRSE